MLGWLAGLDVEVRWFSSAFWLGKVLLLSSRNSYTKPVNGLINDPVCLAEYDDDGHGLVMATESAGQLST